MPRLTLFAAATVAATALAADEAAANPLAPQTSPNVVLLIADDLGYSDLGCYGAPTIATPRIDGMAADGVLLTSFYTQPSCSPTRAALLTGSSSKRVGVIQPLAQWGEFGMSGSEVTVAESLLGVGYTTGFYGKWHLGDSPDQLPDAQGFQDLLYNPWGHLASPSAYLDSRTTEFEWEPDARFDTQRYTERTIEFIQQSTASSTPFFCILSYTAPHYPAVASPAFQGTSADGRDYGDAVEEMDWSVGQILDTIDGLGIQNDTLVIFMSDNGPAQGQGDYQAGAADPLRGSKGSTFEGGVRVPFVARWSSMLAPGTTVDAPAADIDMLPTILGLAGAPLPQGVVLDGADAFPVLQGAVTSSTRPFFFVDKTRVEGVRIGDYKLLNGELYDLANDLGETTNIAATHPMIVAALDAELQAFKDDLDINSRSLSRTQRVISDWRTDSGLPQGSTVPDGALWQEFDQGVEPWTVQDLDASSDLEVRPRVGPGPFNVPNRVLRQTNPAADVRLVRNESALPGDSVFTVALWSRSLEAAPVTPICLLDIGDGNEGMSWTVGDAGILGDDTAPGRADDLRIRIGGASSPESITLDCDLPGAWTDRMIHAAITYDDDGSLTLYIQGIPVQSQAVTAGSLRWGAGEKWALMGRVEALGGDGGTGLLPFPAAGCAADLAGFTLRDRALRRVEIERSYARHGKYPYCDGLPGNTGTPAVLDFRGSFHLPDDSLEVVIEGLPPGTFGYLIASSTQRRTPISNGYVCLDQPIFRLAGQVPLSDAAGVASFVLNRSLAPAQLGLDGAPVQHFQFWYRDGSASNFSNGMQVTFTP